MLAGTSVAETNTNPSHHSLRQNRRLRSSGKQLVRPRFGPLGQSGPTDFSMLLREKQLEKASLRRCVKRGFTVE
jgi:hypothetical protein